MNTRIVKQLAALNNSSITYMERCLHREAIERLTYSLKILEQLCRNDTSTLLTVNEKEKDCGMRLISYRLPESVPIEQSLNGGGFAFFNFALMIDLDDKTRKTICCSDDEILTRISAIALYNLALCYHREGIISLKTKAITKALQLYRSAVSIIAKEAQYIISYNNYSFFEKVVGTVHKTIDLLSLLSLAVLNNTGHIHAYFYNQKESHSCHDFIQKILESLIEHDRDCFYQDDKEAAEFFYKHLALFPTYTFSVAPAC